jgi:hypothetical protein
MYDRQLVPDSQEFRKGACCGQHIPALVVCGQGVPPLQQGIAAKGCDHQHG